MNRRTFIQSLAAAFALPATSPLSPVLAFRPAAAAVPTAAASASAAAMATKARFWTIYMYAKHGNCTPATLSTILNVPETQAHGYLTDLVADGTIQPRALLRHSIRKVVDKSVQTDDGDGLMDKIRERLRLKKDADPKERQTEPPDETGDDWPEEADENERAESLAETESGEAERMDEATDAGDPAPAAQDDPAIEKVG